MPLVKLQDIGQSARLGLWQIDEPVDFFYKQLDGKALDAELSQERMSDRRYLEYLASRHLLHHMAGDIALHLSKDEHGKLVAANNTFKISITHSGNMTAAILSDEHEVGIDIEGIDERIHRVKHKFLNSEEEGFWSGEPDLQELIVCWCAKESIYKWYGKRQLRFQEHILLDKPGAGDQGTFKGYLKNGEIDKAFDVQFEKVDRFMLAYVIGGN